MHTRSSHGRRLFGTPRTILKWILMWECWLHSTASGQNQVEVSCKHRDELSGYIRGTEVGHLNDYQFFKDDCLPWNLSHLVQIFICIFKRCKYIHYHLHYTTSCNSFHTIYTFKILHHKNIALKILILMEKFRQGHKPNFTREKISNIFITVLLPSWYANK